MEMEGAVGIDANALMVIRCQVAGDVIRFHISLACNRGLLYRVDGD